MLVTREDIIFAAEMADTESGLDRKQLKESVMETVTLLKNFKEEALQEVTGIVDVGKIAKKLFTSTTTKSVELLDKEIRSLKLLIDIRKDKELDNKGLEAKIVGLENVKKRVLLQKGKPTIAKVIIIALQVVRATYAVLIYVAGAVFGITGLLAVTAGTGASAAASVLPILVAAIIIFIALTLLIKLAVRMYTKGVKKDVLAPKVKQIATSAVNKANSKMKALK